MKRVGFLVIALWFVGMNSKAAYAQRVWSLVSSDFKGSSLQFPTTDTGYAIVRGDSLIRTTDGGQSWSAVDLPIARSQYTHWTSITFYGSLGWFLTTVGYIPTASRLLLTTNYGFSWVELPLDSSFNPPNSPEGIYFKSPSLGYLWGDGYLYLSTDSGRSWQFRAALPACALCFGGSVDAVGQPNVILSEAGIVDCFGCTHLYLSTDTGATWSASDSIYHLPGGGFSPAIMAYIGSSTWVTYNAWTTDNGKSWDTIATTAQKVAPIFTDTLGHGMMNGVDTTKRHQYDSILYFTTDFGHSWDSTKVPFKSATYIPASGGGWYAVTGTSLYRNVSAASSASQPAPPSQFRILTNPAAHLLKVSMENIPDELHIVDFLGRTVARYSANGNEFSVDVSMLPEGLYWVETRDGAQPFVHIRE